MNIELVQGFLLWCIGINAGILTIWFIGFAVASDLIYGLHSKWFNISREHFDAIHYAGMAAFKMAVCLLNVVPWLALMMVNQ